jgi:hypothetical protein
MKQHPTLCKVFRIGVSQLCLCGANEDPSIDYPGSVRLLSGTFGCSEMGTGC